MTHLLHWLNTELWAPMWPNIFSPNFWTLAAIGLHLAATLAQRARHEKRADERHEDLKRHVTEQAGGGG